MIETLYVETSSRCNLACAYCYRTGREYASKNRDMPPALLQKLVADCCGQRERLFGALKPDIFLHSYGEPTLHPELAAMIRCAAQAGLFGNIRFVSNLQAVPPDTYRHYFDAGLTGLYVSLDTLNAEHLGQTRRGTDLPRLLDALAKLSEDHADRLCVISVLTPTTRHALPDVGALLSRHGIGVWNVQLLNTRNGRFGLDADTVSGIKEDLLGRFPALTIRFEEESLLSCRQPFTTLAVNAMGYLTPCCSLTNHEVIAFGNVGEAPLADLCHGEPYTAFRRHFREKRPPACAGCPYYGTPAGAPESRKATPGAANAGPRGGRPDAAGKG
jgi:radical SAM protein with 4Fe4S-binding SPASM domain